VVLVSIQGFGSIWEPRIGRDPSDPFRYSRHAAFFNTTGIQVNGKFRYRWRAGGKIRFEGGSWFDSVTPHHNLNKVFECDEPEERPEWVQMCCKRRLPKPEVPDYFLFCILSGHIGRLKMRDRRARSEETYVLSYSADYRAKGLQQEVLILMRPDSWICGERGRLVVEPHPRRPWAARLVFEERS
jgi:hypothetical protein